ncbi:hypothetical protein GQ457_05G024130 [Hibiscus cannabinus]
MEQNLAVRAKRAWSIVRAVLFMMKRGIFSKPKFKFMVHLHMLLKRGKIATSIANVPSSSSAAHGHEYEFSCSNTPNYIFPFNLATAKKKTSYYHHFFACTHAPPTHDEDMATFKVVLEMLNNNAGAASPMLPGFGQTPLVRQLRITDSPFPLRDADEGNDSVDKAAEDFIQKFYKDLKLQK